VVARASDGPKLSPEQKAEILGMLASGLRAAAEIGRIFRVHRATISRVVAEALARWQQMERGRASAPRQNLKEPSIKPAVYSRFPAG
jgi:DNA invertase Pin-like site-specific DNA recombinase